MRTSAIHPIRIDSLPVRTGPMETFIGSVLAAMQIHRNGHLLRLLCRDDANPRSAEQSVASLHSATIVKRENPMGVGENGVKRPTFGKFWTEQKRPEHDAGAA